MTSNVIKMPGISEVPKNAKVLRSKMDTVELTPAGVRRWKRPPFQRELRVTPKVLALRDEIAVNGGVLPGVITLGTLGADTYLVDGQHRTEAFLLTDLPVGYKVPSIGDASKLTERMPSPPFPSTHSQELREICKEVRQRYTDDIVIAAVTHAAGLAWAAGFREGKTCKGCLWNLHEDPQHAFDVREGRVPVTFNNIFESIFAPEAKGKTVKLASVDRTKNKDGN